jgi:hypothetical protein
MVLLGAAASRTRKSGERGRSVGIHSPTRNQARQVPTASPTSRDTLRFRHTTMPFVSTQLPLRVASHSSVTKSSSNMSVT